ncbi:hypothetical protein [Azospirillum halopraeferens]|uniref:hypothetical protein n=1 Tax=Azospirillum halopraeferens TaxID=34010 RepID=UPI0004084434|nr:hypothetical protein [Azospirillum halopraeferens]
MSDPQKPDKQKFADLGRPRRIWAVGAVHAEAGRLAAVHAAIAAEFRPGDRLVYLGNLIGRGEAVLDTLDEVLGFRRTLLARRGMAATDIVYLRGGQEEMWQKLLQLHFAPNPREVLDWMMRQGLAPTLAAYGGTVEQGMAAARGGTVALGRWTASLRNAMQGRDGHATLFSALRRAAYTGSPEAPEPGGVLLVNAGIDPSRPFGHQGDSFWWGAHGFARIDAPYGGFARVVRGYDPAGQGVRIGDVTATLDGGCGSGGPLVCGLIAPTGEVLELFQA